MSRINAFTNYYKVLKKTFTINAVVMSVLAMFTLASSVVWFSTALPTYLYFSYCFVEVVNSFFILSPLSTFFVLKCCLPPNDQTDENL